MNHLRLLLWKTKEKKSGVASSHQSVSLTEQCWSICCQTTSGLLCCKGSTVSVWHQKRNSDGHNDDDTKKINAIKTQLWLTQTLLTVSKKRQRLLRASDWVVPACILWGKGLWVQDRSVPGPGYRPWWPGRTRRCWAAPGGGNPHCGRGQKRWRRLHWQTQTLLWKYDMVF